MCLEVKISSCYKYLYHYSYFIVQGMNYLRLQSNLCLSQGFNSDLLLCGLAVGQPFSLHYTMAFSQVQFSL